VIPAVRFVQPIPFHPNVSRDGEMCLDSPQARCANGCSIIAILEGIQMILDAPICDSPANPIALELCLRNYTEYRRIAGQSVTTELSGCASPI
jgi:ubiquitin-protein ligase